MSGRFELQTEDFIKIGKGALLAMVGALAGYLASLAADWQNSPGYTVIAAALASTLANAILKRVKDNSKAPALVLWAVFLSLPGSLVWADTQAVISGPNKFKPDSEYTLSAKRSTDAISYEWSVAELPEYDLGAFTWDDDRLVSVMFPTPGTYTIVLKVKGKPDEFTEPKTVEDVPGKVTPNPEYVKWLEDRVYKKVTVVTESVAKHVVVVGDPKPNPQPGPDPAPNKVDRVTFVYEKSKHPVPPEVASALSKLNTEKGILATLFEQDSVDGDGDTPDQYKIALKAAKEAGLPCLVVQAGEVVYKVKVSPKTATDVTEAVK